LFDLKEIKNETFKKENFYFLAIILFIFFIDRYSKIKIINDFSETRVYLNDFLNFDLTWNTGIGFGFLSTNSNLMYNSITGIIGLVVILLIILIVKSKNIDKVFFL